ncbi:MAG: hypothetical protein H0T47_18605 [Planctomycetaceae bacterium]|nr:hypothetical protein [Planctomycetaceae bacterium]
MRLESNPCFHDLKPVQYRDDRGRNLAPSNLVGCRGCGRVGRLANGAVWWLTLDETEAMEATLQGRKTLL